jgi:hypothetical protein
VAGEEEAETWALPWMPRRSRPGCAQPPWVWLCEVAGRLERRTPKPTRRGSSRAARPCRILCRLLLASLLLSPVAEPAARLAVHPGGKYRHTQRVEIRLAGREKQEVNEIGNEIWLAAQATRPTRASQILFLREIVKSFLFHNTTLGCTATDRLHIVLDQKLIMPTNYAEI